MSFLDQVIDQIKSSIERVMKIIRSALLGDNNERLDFLMDSFYKLNPNQRNGVLAGLIGIVCVFVFSAIFLYFSQINSLKKELNDSFKALHELHVRRTEHELEDKRFEKLVGLVSRKTRRIKVKPLFESIAKQQAVQIEGLAEQNVPIAVDNPLANSLQKIKVDLSFPKVSIPKLLGFLIEVEKSNSFLTVEDLQIRSRYGTKLFFSANVKVRGFKAK